MLATKEFEPDVGDSVDCQRDKDCDTSCEEALPALIFIDLEHLPIAPVYDETNDQLESTRIAKDNNIVLFNTENMSIPIHSGADTPHTFILIISTFTVIC